MMWIFAGLGLIGAVLLVEAVVNSARGERDYWM